MRYVRDLRLACARKLPAEQPGMEIREIATRAGYPDQGHFSRVSRQGPG